MAGEADHTVDMKQIRNHFDGLYIANGGYDKLRGNTALSSDTADLVAYGIPYLANPDLAERFLHDAPLNEPDQATFYGGDAHGYTDYPSMDA